MGEATLIAIRAPRSGTGESPFQIQAQVLREAQPCSDDRETSKYTIPAAAQAAATSSRSHRRVWRKSDVSRAIAAAEKAGLRGYRVEIAPDGTISIVVGLPDATDPSPD